MAGWLRAGVFLLMLGGMVGGDVAARAEAEAVRPVMRDFLGVNGHTVQFRPELYKPVCTVVRDYHPVSWDLGEDTGKMPTFPMAKNKVSWEQVYGSWKKAGYRINACLMMDSVGPKKWKDGEKDGEAYGKLFAKWFGPGGKLPMVETVEIGNEPGNYTDEEYVKVFKAMVKGLRAADKKLKIGTCNVVVGKSGKYAKGVELFAGLDFDVLTIHTYAQLEPWPTWKRSYPEDGRLDYLKDVRELAKWRDAKAKGKPIWITEFGYDATTKKPDPKTEFKKWEGATETQQAEWLVRSALVFSAMPVERAYVYFFNDKDDPQVHGSSGLTRNFEPKPAYWALAQMQKKLGDYQFSKVLEEKAGEVYAYEFVHEKDAGKKVVVVWRPTGDGKSGVADLSGKLAGWEVVAAEEMVMAKEGVGMLSGVTSGKIPVREEPVYLELKRK